MNFKYFFKFHLLNMVVISWFFGNNSSPGSVQKNATLVLLFTNSPFKISSRSAMFCLTGQFWYYPCKKENFVRLKCWYILMHTGLALINFSEKYHNYRNTGFWRSIVVDSDIFVPTYYFCDCAEIFDKFDFSIDCWGQGQGRFFCGRSSCILKQ